jgi:hypothetical protein
MEIEVLGGFSKDNEVDDDAVVVLLIRYFSARLVEQFLTRNTRQIGNEWCGERGLEKVQREHGKDRGMKLFF